MALDPARAALVMQPYRYATNEDASIKALFPQAVEITIDTNLDASGGVALSNSLFASSKVYARVFEVVVEDVLYAEDFIGGAPRYVINFASHPSAGTNRTYTVIRAQVDYMAGTTTLSVRG